MGLGVKVSDSTSSTAIQGFIEQVGGPIATLGVTNAGIGYSNGTFNRVPLYAITGKGSGATASVTISNGVVSSVTITSSEKGGGYVVGDVVGLTTSNLTKGDKAEITIASLGGVGTLYLNNVQGEEFTTGQPIVVYEGATATSYASTTITSSETFDARYDR